MAVCSTQKDPNNPIIAQNQLATGEPMRCDGGKGGAGRWPLGDVCGGAYLSVVRCWRVVLLLLLLLIAVILTVVAVVTVGDRGISGRRWRLFSSLLFFYNHRRGLYVLQVPVAFGFEREACLIELELDNS